MVAPGTVAPRGPHVRAPSPLRAGRRPAGRRPARASRRGRPARGRRRATRCSTSGSPDRRAACRARRRSRSSRSTTPTARPARRRTRPPTSRRSAPAPSSSRCSATTPTAATVREVLAGFGVGTAGVVTDPSRPTAAKRRVLADEALVARFDTSSREPLDADRRAAVHDALRTAVDGRRRRGRLRLRRRDPRRRDGGAGRRSLLEAPGERTCRLIVDAHDPGALGPGAPRRRHPQRRGGEAPAGP